MAELAGVDDTISWWDENGTPMVLIQSDMNNAPVQVIRTGNDLNIKAYISFSGGSNDIFPGTEPNAITYAEIIKEAIESNWRGEYEVYGQSLSVTTTVYSNSYNRNNALNPYSTGKGDKQRTLSVAVHNKGSKITTSYVSSWVAGVSLEFPMKVTMKYFQTEQDRTIWTVKIPGTVHLYNRYKENMYSLKRYREMVAHEFGHVLGIGDAYNAWYRGGTFPNQDGYYAPRFDTVYYNGISYQVETPYSDMMLSNQHVSDNDIRMVWDAWRTGEPQFFPWGSKSLRNR